MPFLLVTGYPACGKSTIVDRIAEHFREKGKEVNIIREDDYHLFDRSVYNDATKEKEFRSYLRSELQKMISKKNIVICDGLNYIKGFRYELFLVGKLAKTTYAVLQIDGTKETCRYLNEQKSPNERQVGRLETEDPTFSDDLSVDLDRSAPRYVSLPLTDLYEWLIEGTALKENQSTTTVPLAPTNFLHELDRTTQEVIQYIVEAQRTAIIGQEIVVTHAEDGKNKLRFTKVRSLPELSRLRRQFISFSKTHPIEKKEVIASLFVDYLNSQGT
ncbi:unnamed protein product, partial [Mesorhabditis belari]|uniref:Protein KTI12 homolog n=1 Tax=Mesorhabditis belari TaxID=2138241 RepID=A0AAF3EKI0_9BILA